MLKIIYSDSKKFDELMKQESDVHYSKSASSHLMTEETYKSLNQKYNLEHYNEELEKDESDKYGEEINIYSSFLEFLETHFEDKDIGIETPWFVYGNISISLAERTDMIADLYDENELNETAEESIQDLFNSSDWALTLEKDVKIFFVDLLRDNLDSTLKDMVKAD